MKCPKCGQEMININNQYICTACGIVANEFSPKSQVLASIKRKMAAAQTIPQQEQYISPTAVATVEKPAGVSTMHNKENSAVKVDMSGKTLDQLARDVVNQNQTREDIGGAPVPGFSVESTPNMVPETEGEKVIPRPQVAQEQSIPTQETPIQISEAVPNNAENGSLFIPPEAQAGQSTVMTPQPGEKTDLVGTTGSQMVYPSHQINPILIKILITVFILLFLFIAGY
ncbi:MAG: hypothetical protein AAB632_02900, partial [Patescibacteria group bacterium]